MRARCTVGAVAALVASLTMVGLAPPPASAAPIAMSLQCESNTPIGTISTTQDIGFDINTPARVQTGTDFTSTLTFPASSVPSSQQGGAATVDSIKNLSYRVSVPANSRYVSGSLSGGSNYGSGAPTVTLSGSATTGTVIYAIPGPIPTDQQFQLPALSMRFTAIGAIGSTISLQLAGTSVSDPGFTTTAHLVAPFSGDAATSCFEPAPKTTWSTTTIIPTDTTPPTITITTPAEGGQYPQGATVPANYACNDGAVGTGVATCTGNVANGAFIDTADLGPHSFTVNATDAAGNAATPVVHHYDVVPAGDDNAPPSASIASPANGAVYTLNASATASYSCLDQESGIASCTGARANGAAIDTSSLGAHSFAVLATDKQGNPTAEATSYRVVPAPSAQSFTSGDVTNQVPVACDNMFQTLHKTIPVSGNLAPTSAASGGQFTWSVALGADFIPTLNNGTNIVYTFAAPTNGHFVSATLTGAGSMVNGAAISVRPNGTVQLSIASVTDQGTLGIGNDNFTPPPFDAVVAVDGAAGTTVSDQLASFDVTTTVAGGLPLSTTSHCTGGDPTFNGRTNPNLFQTTSIDATPPTVTIASPTQGRLVEPGASLTFQYSCGDNGAAPTCTSANANGSALPTSTSGPRQVSVTATDAAGNATTRWATYVVDDPTLTIADASTVEGDGATVDFDVTLSNPSARTITVNYSTADGTATAPGDYTSTAGALTFAPGGPLTKTVSVPVGDNSSWQGNRSFTLEVLTATRAEVADGIATGQIVDDDPPPVQVSNTSVTEGPNAQLDFTVTMTVDPNFPATVNYATADGTATAPARYAAASGSLTFTPGGSLVRHVVVPVVNDSLYNETSVVKTQTMTLTASEANGFSASGTGTITDDESPPAFVSIGAVNIREGDTGTRTAHLALTLDKPTTQAVTLSFATVNGTAIGGTDFTAKSGTVKFAAGTVTKTVGVVVRADTAAENDETLTVRLSNAVGAKISHGDGTVTIADDDHPTATGAELSVSDPTIYEGGGGGTKTTTLTFDVTLNRKLTAASTVQWALVPGNAKLGFDYVGKSGTLKFGVLAVAKTVTVQIKTDALVEPDEQFQLVVSSPTGPITVAKAGGTGTILNDD
jgi:hypothetical protein